MVNKSEREFILYGTPFTDSPSTKMISVDSPQLQQQGGVPLLDVKGRRVRGPTDLELLNRFIYLQSLDKPLTTKKRLPKLKGKKIYRRFNRW